MAFAHERILSSTQRSPHWINELDSSIYWAETEPVWRIESDEKFWADLEGNETKQQQQQSGQK